MPGDQPTPGRGRARSTTPPPEGRGEDTFVISVKPVAETEKTRYKYTGFYVTQEQIDALDRIAKATNRSRAEVVRILLDQAIKQVKIN